MVDVLIRPLLTEKSTDLKEDFKQYVFMVGPKATKGQIKQAVEQLFKVRVQQVRTLPKRGKERRMGRTSGYTNNYKKAIVRVAKDQKIDFEKF